MTEGSANAPVGPSMAGALGAPAPLGVAMLGSAFMGRVHSHAARAVSFVAGPLPRPLRLVSVCGRDRSRLDEMRFRYGWDEATADWRAQVGDPRVELFINAGPNALHAQPTIAAANNGKHVLCEKPLGLSVAEAEQMWRAAEASGVVNACGLNYRFIPAVRLVHEMLAAGELGEVFHFRSRFLLGHGINPELRETTWRLQRSTAGGGALADLGVHHFDLVRYLVGEPLSVLAMTRLFRPQRENVTVDTDDSFHAILEVAGGATAVVEGSRMAGGHTVHSSFEIDGSKGSVAFSLDRHNELQMSHGSGFRTVSVTNPAQPFMAQWWPVGHSLGWADCFIHQLGHVLSAIVEGGEISPVGATFYDGYRCALICDAIERSHVQGTRQSIVQAAETVDAVNELTP
jgi:predicted dehydrogenase